MAQYRWNNAPDSTKRQVDYFIRGCQKIIEHNLLGVYLHGSLAMGTFNPQRSDLDLLVVTHEPLSIANRYQIAAELIFIVSGHPSPVEVSFLNRGQLAQWQYPTPFDFHYSETWRKRFEDDLEAGRWKDWDTQPRTDYDLAAHFTLLYHYGVELFGEPITNIFPSIPEADFRDSILRDFDDIQHDSSLNPVYKVLNMCRLLHYLQEGAISSKNDGALWALEHLPEDYHTLIKQALDAYRYDRPEPNDETALRSFMAYVDVIVKELRA